MLILLGIGMDNVFWTLWRWRHQAKVLLSHRNGSCRSALVIEMQRVDKISVSIFSNRNRSLLTHCTAFLSSQVCPMGNSDFILAAHFKVSFLLPQSQNVELVWILPQGMGHSNAKHFAALTTLCGSTNLCGKAQEVEFEQYVTGMNVNWPWLCHLSASTCYTKHL